MKLTAGEIAVLLPLLRPDVLIEIVLHHAGTESVPAVDGRKRKWTQEEKDAAARRMREGRQRRQQEALAATEPTTEAIPESVVVNTPAPKHDPNAAQVSVIREAIQREREQNGVKV